jgi:large subunit ribosomal protein L6
MKQKLTEKIKIPENITCTYENKTLTCKNSDSELSKKLFAPTISIKIENNEVIIEAEKGNKLQYKKIKTFEAHVKNIFRGLIEKFTYKLESANVHFPMTLKVEGNILTVGNFLGEKIPRHSKILPNVTVEIKGQEITITSNDKEAAGQTAANMEKVTKVRGRDNRIFQDGIYITEKPEKSK